MRDFHNRYVQQIIINFINDAIVPLSHSIFLLAGKLFGSMGAGISSQSADALCDSVEVFPRQRFKLFGR